MWATQYIQQLKEGKTIQFRPHGNSMQGRISSGQLVTVEPTEEIMRLLDRSSSSCRSCYGRGRIFGPGGGAECRACSGEEHKPIKEGDVVLCKVNGKQWLHLVSAIGSDGRFQISNNKGHINGWCTQENIFGVVIRVED